MGLKEDNQAAKAKEAEEAKQRELAQQQKEAEEQKIADAAKTAEQRVNPISHAQGEIEPSPDPAAWNEKKPNPQPEPDHTPIDQSDSAETHQATTETYTTGQEDHSSDHSTTIDPMTGHAVTWAELRQLEADRRNEAAENLN